jgi:hypothetical protein
MHYAQVGQSAECEENMCVGRRFLSSNYGGYVSCYFYYLPTYLPTY